MRSRVRENWRRASRAHCNGQAPTFGVGLGVDAAHAFGGQQGVASGGAGGQRGSDEVRGIVAGGGRVRGGSRGLRHQRRQRQQHEQQRRHFWGLDEPEADAPAAAGISR